MRKHTHHVALSAALTAATALAVGVVALVSNSGTITKRPVTVVRPTIGPPPAAGELVSPAPLKGGPAPQTIQRNGPNENKLLAPHAVGGAQIYSCPTLYHFHLWSSRNGIRPTEFVLHYTAGNGTAESIDSYFGGFRGASATYLLEPNGHCRQEVPESEKPWTQLAANPYAISVEIVTTGWNVSRTQWLAMPIFKRGILAALMRDSMTRNGIPIRYVDPVGCNFIPGYTDHDHLECGNNHTDVLPNFPWDVLARQLAGPVPVSAHATGLCRELLRYRAKPSPGGRGRAAAVRRVLVRHGYRCDTRTRRAVRK